MDQSNSMENLHYPMSVGNVRNLARLFEDNSVSRKPNFTLTKSKSKSYSNVTITRQETISTSMKQFPEENETLSFRDIHSKFESGKMTGKHSSLQRLPSITSLECVKLQEIKEISARTDAIAKKIKTSEKKASAFYIMHLNEIVELLLQIGQIETFGNSSIQTEKLSTLQILQKCYSQLRGKLEVFLGDDNSEEEEQKVSIRSSIQRWENMIENKTQYVAPNYSVHYSSNLNSNGTKWNDKNIVENKTDIVKCGEPEDDLKVVEHVKVQNLKDIWERRGSEEIRRTDFDEHDNSEDSIEEDKEVLPETLPRYQNKIEENQSTYEEIIDIQNETPEEQIDLQNNIPESNVVEINTKEEIISTPLINIEDQVKNEDEIEIQDKVKEEKVESIKEETQKIIESQLEFLNQEQKHTEDTFYEEPVLDSQTNIEYVREAPQETTREHSQETPQQETPQQEIPQQEIPQQEIPQQTSQEISQTISSQVQTQKEIKDNEDDDDDEFVTPRTLVTSVTNFLDEERKNSDLQLDEVDPMFGPPTGIVPDPTKHYETVQINDEKPSDDQFIVIYEKPDESAINLNRDEKNSGNPDTASSKDTEHMVIEENVNSKEGNYLILDNRTPEEIVNEKKSSQDENILVNGDRI